MKTYEEIAARIRASEEWNEEDIKALCEAADMTEEYEDADGDTFETVVFAAAEKLGVEII